MHVYVYIHVYKHTFLSSVCREDESAWEQQYASSNKYIVCLSTIILLTERELQLPFLSPLPSLFL